MRQRRRHIRELDGIRAIAVALILSTHLFNEVPSLVPHWYVLSMPAPIRFVVTHGWLGVDLFFVLSGFLITRILLDSKGKAGYFRGFYVRRILRILPLYYTVVAILIAAYGYQHYATYWNFALGLCANLSTLAQTDVPAAAGPIWSLGVEEQFYLFWPLVVLALSRRILAGVAIAIVIIEPFVRYHLGAGQLLYPWCRFDGMALGSLLALWFSSPRRNARASLRLAAGLAALSLAIIVVAAPFGGFEEGPVSTAIRISEGTLLFGAAIAACIALRGSPALGFLRSRPARITADFSFCLYLVHVPIAELFEYVSHVLMPSISTWSPVVLAPVRATIVIIVAFGVAALSRRYLELPCMRLRTAFLPAEARAAAPASRAN